MYSIHTPFLVVANVKLNCLFHVLTIWNVRPAGDLSNDVKADVVVDDDDEVVVMVEELLNETTPYSTPCATSPYYTPQSSPTRGNG
jgi:hypothetical protein